MAGTLNKTMLNIGRDGHLRALLSVATSERWKDRVYPNVESRITRSR